MKYSIQKGEEKLNPLVQKLIDRKVKKLDSLLSHFDADMLDLKITVEEIDNKNLFIIDLVLSLPNQVLKAEKQSKDVMEAMGSAFDTLIREVKRFKEKLRKEFNYKEQVK